MVSAAFAKKAFVACAAAGFLNLLAVDLWLGPIVFRAPAPVALVQETTSPADAGVQEPSPATLPSVVRGAEPRVVARFDIQASESIVDTELRKLASEMIADRTVDVVLEGHSDPSGDAEYNKLLSLERAQWARQRLVALGVSPSRIQAVGLGSSRAIADSPSSNRRVEARFVPAGSLPAAEEPKAARVETVTKAAEDAGAAPAPDASISTTEQDAGAAAPAEPATPDAGDDPWTQ